MKNFNMNRMYGAVALSVTLGLFAAGCQTAQVKGDRYPAQSTQATEQTVEQVATSMGINLSNAAAKQAFVNVAGSLNSVATAQILQKLSEAFKGNAQFAKSLGISGEQAATFSKALAARQSLVANASKGASTNAGDVSGMTRSGTNVSAQIEANKNSFEKNVDVYGKTHEASMTNDVRAIGAELYSVSKAEGKLYIGQGNCIGAGNLFGTQDTIDNQQEVMAAARKMGGSFRNAIHKASAEVLGTDTVGKLTAEGSGKNCDLYGAGVN